MKTSAKRPAALALVLALALALVLLLALLPGSALAADVVASGTCGENGSSSPAWVLDTDGVLRISGEGSIRDYDVSQNNMPWYTYRNSITRIIIESGVRSIGSAAFWGCSNIASIVIPSSVLSIGNAAIPTYIPTIDVEISDLRTWCYSSIEKNALPTYYLYLNGSEVKELTIPEGIRYIKDRAFSGCLSLTSVTIPSSVIDIGQEAFQGCLNLQRVEISDLTAWCRISVGENGNPLKYAGHLWLNGVEITELTIPAEVTSIRPNTFEGCCGLTDVTIPDGVTSIGDYAFYRCTGLVRSEIADTVTSIGKYAFSECDALTSVSFPIRIHALSEGLFEGCDVLDEISIPDSVEEIGERAFADCVGLTSIKLSVWVEALSPSVFSGCTGLTSVDLRSRVTELPSGIFRNCTSLRSIIIPGSVTTIDSYAFDGCSCLTEIVIPDSVTTINSYAFNGCSGMTEIVVPNSVTSIGSNAFADCSSLCSITLPFASFRETDSLTGDYAKRYPLGYIFGGAGEGLTPVEQTYVRGYCYNSGRPYYDFYFEDEYKETYLIPGSLHSVTVSSSGGRAYGGGVLGFSSTVFDYAFENCTMITDVTLGDTVNGVSRDSFIGCTGLTSVSIPTGFSFNNQSFKGCENLSECCYRGNFLQWNDVSGHEWQPKSMIRFAEPLGEGSCGGAVFFSGNTDTGMLELNGMGAVTSAPWQSAPDKWKSVEIAAGITEIPDMAFKDCTSLTDVYYDGFRSDWAAVTIGTGNECLTGANLHCRAPGVIAAVTAAAEHGKTVVSWEASEGATAYILQRRVKDTDTWTTLKSSVTGLRYEDPTGIAGTVYQYQVRGRNGTDYGAFKASNSVRAIAELTTPGAISTVTATAAPGKTTVSWTASERATAYIIQRRVKDSDTWTTLKSNVTATSYEDTTGVAGTVYQYRVRGRDGTDYGPFKVCSVVRAQAGAALPGAIAAVTAKATAAPGQITVTWTASSGATAYIIQRRVKGSDTWTTLKSNVTGTSYVDAAGVAGTVYQYRVRGRDGTNYGSFKVSSVVRALAA